MKSFLLTSALALSSLGASTAALAQCYDCGHVQRIEAYTTNRSGTGGAVAGAVVGGLIGNAVERDATTRQADEILLQLKNGDRRAVVQPLGGDVFAVGDPVILVTTGGRTRVMHAPPVTGSAQPAYPATYPAPAPQ